ncbi:hypothetical protein VQL36_05705 [Chengkuizengella sp. SCS-71B]|uniref:hypothetical protein n=1 Tax=Chengkuizengella sp. SCS-71B TaxID=3115290 RepID=UPI0032C21F44
MKISEQLLERDPISQMEIPIKDDEGNEIGTRIEEYPSGLFASLTKSQDKYFSQCRAAASDLGLTISTRCKLVIPKQEVKEQTKLEKDFGGDV